MRRTQKRSQSELAEPEGPSTSAGRLSLTMCAHCVQLTRCDIRERATRLVEVAGGRKSDTGVEVCSDSRRLVRGHGVHVRESTTRSKHRDRIRYGLLSSTLGAVQTGRIAQGRLIRKRDAVGQLSATDLTSETTCRNHIELSDSSTRAWRQTAE
jgi:hypothetical protein